MKLPAKAEIEAFCIEHEADRKIPLDKIIGFLGLNEAKIQLGLKEKHAPKPEPLITNMAIYPMRRHKGWKYNIFNTANGLFAGIVFDRNRRPYYQTLSLPLADAIRMSKSIAEQLAKGQCISVGFKLDEGKTIREKQEQARTGAAKIRRGNKS